MNILHEPHSFLVGPTVGPELIMTAQGHLFCYAAGASMPGPLSGAPLRPMSSVRLRRVGERFYSLWAAESK